LLNRAWEGKDPKKVISYRKGAVVLGSGAGIKESGFGEEGFKGAGVEERIVGAHQARS